MSEPNAVAALPVERRKPSDARKASRSFWSVVGRRLSRDPVTLFCAAILLLVVLAAIFAPFIAPHDPYKTSMVYRLRAPGADPRWILGTDELGRDLLSRLIYGGRLSLFMGFAPVFLATMIGGTLGIVAGYVGGRTNMAIMRSVDVFYAFPSVLLAVAISGALGAGLVNTIVSMTLVFIPPVARISESVTTQIRAQDFIKAARATGAGHVRIVFGHVMSNVVGPILSYSSSLISVAIVMASGLSFLGLGVTPPEPEWGLMLNTLRQSIYAAPVNAVLPGVMIFVTSVCLSMLSDGLRQAMDVKQ